MARHTDRASQESFTEDGENTDDDGTPPPGSAAFLEGLARSAPLAHPRLIPRALLAERTRFPRASSPMDTPDPRAPVCLPSPVAHPKHAPMFLVPPRRR